MIETTTPPTNQIIEWTNSKGHRVVATLSIQTREIAYCDGDNVEIPCCRWHERVEIDGIAAGYGIATIPACKVGEVTVVARAGNVGIPIEQMARIETARAELRATPVWMDHQAEIARNRTEAREYEASQRAMSGWCDRCQSCCYGDCQS